MRGWLSLPVLSSTTGEIMGMIAPRQGLLTNYGEILRYEGSGVFTFLDDNGVIADHSEAAPWVEEDEALRWGFLDSERLTTAIAV